MGVQVAFGAQVVSAVQVAPKVQPFPITYLSDAVSGYNLKHSFNDISALYNSGMNNIRQYQSGTSLGVQVALGAKVASGVQVPPKVQLFPITYSLISIIRPGRLFYNFSDLQIVRHV